MKQSRRNRLLGVALVTCFAAIAAGTSGWERTRVHPTLQDSRVGPHSGPARVNLSPTRLAGQWTRALTYEDHEPPSSSRLASGASERELWVEVRGHPDRPVRGWLELLPRNAIDQRLELDEQGRSWIGGLDSDIDTVRIGCAGLSPFERELPRTRAPRR